MEVFEINPHIRFCRIMPKPHGARVVRTYDCRIFYLLKGACTFTLGERTYPLKENTLLYIPSGVPYLLHYEVSAPIELLIVNFDFDQSHRHLQDPLQVYAPEDFKEADWIRVPTGLPFSEPICIENLSRVQTLFLEMEKELSRGDLYGREYASALLLQILLEILRGRDQRADTKEGLSQQLREYLDSHYTEEITAETLGIRFGYHPYHLNRVFSKQMGTTIRQYLIERRIHAAKNLLLDTELTVGEITSAVGVSDQAYFSYCFKKCVGMSPTEYRNQKGVRYL